MLYFFGLDIKRQYTILNTFTPEIINEAAIYLEINILVLHTAVVLFSTNARDKRSSQKKKREINIAAYRCVAILLLVVSFIYEILVLRFKIGINLTLGYATALNTSYSGSGAYSYIVNFGSTLYLPSFFATIVSSKGRRNLTIFAAFTYAIYLVLYFLSGSRFEAVISLAGVCLLYNFYYKKIRLKSLALIIIVGISVLYICSLFSNIRRITNYDTGDSMSKIIQEAVRDTNDNNIFSDVISTAGTSLLTVTAVYDNCPQNIPYSYGTYYLFGILRVIPNILGGNNILITDSIDKMFRKYLTKTYGMGSSFIIEAYYNFGYLGILMMLVYGYLIAYVVNMMENKKRTGR